MLVTNRVTLEHRNSLVVDAVSSRFPVDKEVALVRMKEAGALLTTTETAIFELLQEAGTPEFREMLDLIRDRSR